MRAAILFVSVSLVACADGVSPRLHPMQHAAPSANAVSQPASSAAATPATAVPRSEALADLARRAGFSLKSHGELPGQVEVGPLDADPVKEVDRILAGIPHRTQLTTDASGNARVESVTVEALDARSTADEGGRLARPDRAGRVARPELPAKPELPSPPDRAGRPDGRDPGERPLRPEREARPFADLRGREGRDARRAAREAELAESKRLADAGARPSTGALAAAKARLPARLAAARAEVRAMIEDREPEFREAAINSFDVRDPKDRAVILGVLRKDPAAGPRRLAAEALVLDRSSETTAALSEALGDPDRDVVMTALRSLRIRMDRDATAALMSLVKSPDPELRLEALRTISIFGLQP